MFFSLCRHSFRSSSSFQGVYRTCIISRWCGSIPIRERIIADSEMISKNMIEELIQDMKERPTLDIDDQIINSIALTSKSSLLNQFWDEMQQKQLSLDPYSTLSLSASLHRMLKEGNGKSVMKILPILLSRDIFKDKLTVFHIKTIQKVLFNSRIPLDITMELKAANSKSFHPAAHALELASTSIRNYETESIFNGWIEKVPREAQNVMAIFMFQLHATQRNYGRAYSILKLMEEKRIRKAPPMFLHVLERVAAIPSKLELDRFLETFFGRELKRPVRGKLHYIYYCTANQPLKAKDFLSCGPRILLVQSYLRTRNFDMAAFLLEGTRDISCLLEYFPLLYRKADFLGLKKKFLFLLTSFSHLRNRIICAYIATLLEPSENSAVIDNVLHLQEVLCLDFSSGQKVDSPDLVEPYIRLLSHHGQYEIAAKLIVNSESQLVIPESIKIKILESLLASPSSSLLTPFLAHISYNTLPKHLFLRIHEYLLGHGELIPPDFLRHMKQKQISPRLVVPTISMEKFLQ